MLRSYHDRGRSRYCVITEVIRYFRDRAKEIPDYSRPLSRVADIEMALFARSRNGLVQCS